MLNFSETTKKLEEIIKHRKDLNKRPNWNGMIAEIMANFSQIGEGAHRYVFRELNSPDIVFKINRGVIVNHCKNEYHQYLNLRHPLDKFVLPPLNVFEYNDIFVLFFPKVKILGHLNSENYAKYNTNRFRQQRYFIEKVFVDSHDENIGIYNNLPVMIDYSQGLRVWELERIEKEAIEILSLQKETDGKMHEVNKAVDETCK